MNPDERLAIIGALEHQSTGTLRNYFFAQGYGPAFDRLPKSSKASRIAETLAAAARDGRDEAILDHARHHFGISTPAPKPTGTDLLQGLNELTFADATALTDLREGHGRSVPLGGP